MEFRCRTDTRQAFRLKSRIVAVRWLNDSALAQHRFALQVHTLFAGRNSKLRVEIFDADDRRVWRSNIAIQYSLQRIDIQLQKTARQFVYAWVELLANGQRQRSINLPLQSDAAVMFGFSWQQQTISRQALTRLRAECRGIADGEQVYIDLYQHVPGLLDKPVCGFATTVYQKKIDQEWRFHYPLPTSALPFPYRRPSEPQTPVFYAVAHYRQLRMVQAPRDGLHFVQDETRLSLSPRSLVQCRAQLYSSDAEQREILLQKDKGIRYSFSPGPFLLKLFIDSTTLRAITRTAQDTHYDDLALPRQLPIKTTDFIDAPVKQRRWQSALACDAAAMHQDVFGSNRVLELKTARPCRYAPTLGLLAILVDFTSRNEGNDIDKERNHGGNVENPSQRWRYFQLQHNLLLPVRAIDASGNHNHGPAIAYVDNQGFVFPFYLCGQNHNYQFALYRPGQSESHTDIIALWSSSGGDIEIDIPLARIKRAIQRLDNRDRAVSSSR